MKELGAFIKRGSLTVCTMGGRGGIGCVGQGGGLVQENGGKRKVQKTGGWTMEECGGRQHLGVKYAGQPTVGTNCIQGVDHSTSHRIRKYLHSTESRLSKIGYLGG